MESKRCLQGRWLGEKDIEAVRLWLEGRSDWSRKRLAKGLCEQWDWRDSRGRLKDFAARSLLLKLEAEGRIGLPPLQENKRRQRPPVPPLAHWQPPPLRQAQLCELMPLQVRVIEPSSPEARRWAYYLDRFHYLGLRIVGENLGYLIRDAHGQDVACLLFGAAAWKCSARDRFLGWERGPHLSGLSRIANNTRFLILPWVRVKCLASHVLGRVSRRIQADWQQKYGHGLDWLETFVETGRFQGTCYAAANWRLVGQTQGRGRQDAQHQRAVAPKKVFLYPLS